VRFHKTQFGEVDEINMFPVAEKIQLEVPPPLIKLKPFRALWYSLTGW